MLRCGRGDSRCGIYAVRHELEIPLTQKKEKTRSCKVFLYVVTLRVWRVPAAPGSVRPAVT